MIRYVARLRRWLEPPNRRRPLTAALLPLSGLAWAVLVRLVETQSVFGALRGLGQGRTWYTALFLGLLLSGLALLTRSLFLGNLLVGGAAMVLTFVNHFKMLIASTPLTAGDLALIRQAGSIARLNSRSLTLSRNSLLAILGAAVWLGAVWLVSRALRSSWKWSLPGGAACLLAFFLIFWTGAEPLVFSPLGAPVDRAMSQLAANRSCGVVLGLWRGWYRSQTRTLPQDYSLEYMEEATAQAEDYAPVLAPDGRSRPHIIHILSESFFDITKLDGVRYDTDPLADFHALQEEGVSGTFYTRHFGYGTCNIELEVFTGVNNGLFDSEGMYTWEPERFGCLPAVPELLRENGYYTSMLHMYSDDVYNREKLFSGLGFDDMYFEEDLAQLYEPAAGAEDYSAFLEEHRAGYYNSDALMTDVLISQYERCLAEKEGPLFLYASSMENHTPYPEDKYGPEELTVRPVTELTGEAAGAILSCSQGLADASAALGRLTDYFRDREEPVVIVFYGDHMAGLGLSEGGSAYSALGLVQADRDLWTLEEQARFYSTDYLIWSNDPDYLPGEPGSTWDTGCSYLGARLLELGGVDLPLYWRVIGRLSRTRVADTADYHLSRAGELSETLPEEGEDALGLGLLKDFINDAVYGKQYVTQRIGRP